jgi:LmbE family N-acetylglucosaminyl deacetylase
MAEPLRLMGIFPHPDDETFGTGGTFAHYAAHGVETSLLCATRGERGWGGPPEENPGLEGLGKIREGELRAAAAALGIKELHFLDYIDGDLDQADAGTAISRMVPHIRRIRPQVVMTFALDGAYGHPDHIAMSQLATAALVCAADPTYAPDGQPPHRVSKLYYKVWTQKEQDYLEPIYGKVSMGVDGVEREGVAWPDWSVTTFINARAEWETVVRAMNCHATQLPPGLQPGKASQEQLERLWGDQSFARVYSLVNNGRKVESDLFEGLR